MADYWADLCARYPIVSIEDGMAEEDWDGWKALTDRLGDRCSWWATTSSSPTPRASPAASTAGRGQLHPGQGQPDRHAHRDHSTPWTWPPATGYTAVMSHRSGETEDATIADLAVATNCGQIKTGAPARSDRVAKYNQLLRIEEQLGDAAAPAPAKPRSAPRRGDPKGAPAARSASTKAPSTKTASTKTASTKTASAKTASAKTASAKTAPAKTRPSTSAPAKGRAATSRSAKARSASTGKALARVDSPAGSRTATSDVARRQRSRRRARLMVGLALTVLLVGVLFVAVLPTPTWLQQRDDTARLEAELAEVQAERAEVAAEIERLGTDAEIEAQARRNGYVKPGEEAYNILPSPVDPIGLPDAWPFTGVEEALGVR
jgi:cell division protein FtsB